MRVAPTLAQFHDNAPHRRGKRTALVPTMGALHEGHISLIETARQNGADYVMATIFVNPAQFAPNEDFHQYPRPIEDDLKKLAAAGVDEVFTPGADAIYPDGFATRVTVGGLSELWEGTYRPGFFTGVATVVVKLFNITKPDLAVFGEKDFQQLQIIRRLAVDMNFNLDIIAAPTCRESSGLALSSRNRYLFPAEQVTAAKLYAKLQETRGKLANLTPHPEFAPQAEKILATSAKQLLTAGFDKIDYLAWVAAKNLHPVAVPPAPGEKTRLLIAAFLGKTRLIDNIEV